MSDDQTLHEFYDELRKTGFITRLVELARDEDLGDGTGAGDVTTEAFVPNWVRGEAKIVFRQAGVVCGLEIIPEILHAFRADVDLEPRVSDGDRVEAGTTVATLVGRTAAMVTAERTILNFVMRLSGIATRTAGFVERVKHTRAGVYDTRKTTPGLRVLEKYAVRCGGGFSRRMGLWDAVLIKDNHLASLRENVSFTEAVREAVHQARQGAGPHGLKFVMLEVDRIEQLEHLLIARGAGVDIVLLDNMGPEDLRRAVAMRDAAKAPLEFEASGGVTLETIGAIAETGVERISVGGLTHGAVALDVGMDM